MMRKRGDTIIEVMVGITIFSMVAVGSIVIMNNGLAMAQRSLELTLVRQQIDAQAEMLRYVSERARDDDAAYVAMWNNITPGVTTVRQILDENTCPEAGSLSGWFVFTPAAGSQIALERNRYRNDPDTYARVDANGSQGISIQLTRVAGGAAYDAYIQACWYGPGSSRPATIGTIVRLYEPSA